MTIQVFGDEQEVFNYSLNKSSITIDKLIITRKEFISQIANEETIKALLEGLSQLTTPNQLESLLENPEIRDALKEPISPQIGKVFLQKVQEFFSSFDQVELKNYSFMNSMNNETYSLHIRTQSNCVFSCENIDKYQFQHAFEEIFTAYLYALSTRLDIQDINFQIEITKCEEMKKHFYLFKESQKLLLFASLGHPQLIAGSAYHINSEQYSSFGDKLFYNESRQNILNAKEGVKMTQTAINHAGKILDEQELIAIHEMTQNYDDSCIEGFINAKGKVELTSFCTSMISIQDTQEENLLLYKSSKKYEDISLLPIHEMDTQTPNPKYVLLRNIGEYKTFMNSKNLSDVDGMVCCFPIFSSQLITICKSLDIDCIMSKQVYEKSLQTKIDWETYAIECTKTQASNPFSSLIPQTKQRSSEGSETTQRMTQIQDELNATISKREPQSTPVSQTHRPMSTSQTAQNTMRTHSAFGGSSGEKKGALAMLADQVVNEPAPEPEPQAAPEPTPMPEQEPTPQPTYTQESSSFEMFDSAPEPQFTAHSQPQVEQYGQSSGLNNELKDALEQFLQFKKESQEKEEVLLRSIMQRL